MLTSGPNRRLSPPPGQGRGAAVRSGSAGACAPRAWPYHGAGGSRQVQLFTQCQRQRGNVHLHAGHSQRRRADAVHHHQAEQGLILAARQRQLGREPASSRSGQPSLCSSAKPVRDCQSAAGSGRLSRIKSAAIGARVSPKDLTSGQPCSCSCQKARAAAFCHSARGSPLRPAPPPKSRRGWGVHLTGQPLCIQLGNALEQQGGAKAIEGDVVHAAVEIIAAGAAQRAKRQGASWVNSNGRRRSAQAQARASVSSSRSRRPLHRPGAARPGRSRPPPYRLRSGP